MIDQVVSPEQQLPPMQGGDRDVAIAALLLAVSSAAERGAGAPDAREVKEFSQAALAFAQAASVLDPTRLQGGDTPEARAAAIPPQPQNTGSTKDADQDGVVGEA